MRQGPPFTARVMFITADDNTPQGVVAVLPGRATGYQPEVEIYTSGGGVANVAVTPPYVYTSSTLPAAGTVCHWAVRYDGSTVSLREAAGLADVTAAAAAPPSYTAEHLLIGFLPGLNWSLNGWFGKFALWPGVATSAEADALLDDAATCWES